MKLISFEHQGKRGVGALIDDEQVVDLTPVVQLPDMNHLIAVYASKRNEIAQAVATRTQALDAARVKLLAPIPEPRRNIFCVGKNYHEHAHEFANSGFDSSAASGAVPKAPIIFSKPPSSVIGPGQPIDASLDPLQSVDYEAELGVIIGKAGRCTEQDDPTSFIFGYTLINDVTSRGLQKQHSQWLLGKGIDTFCPMGPVILTTDAVPSIAALEIRCEVNGQVRQQALLSALIFDVPTLIQTIGRSISLKPGDIIATGTPAGVGIGFDPPKYLQAGDVVRVLVDPIGILENPVI